jgi:glucosamine 6-phosphate synthetase-like amidotransferase/phosphosugar isomerase protein
VTDPAGFLADLEAKPEALQRLAGLLAAGNPWEPLPVVGRRVLFVGMGSSHYAASVAAARLRARGIDAVAELASSHLLPAVPTDPGADVVIAVSASGGSAETLDAVDRYRGHCPVVLLTNRAEAALPQGVSGAVALEAGPEVGGVACRTYQHTLAVLLALEAYLAARPGAGPGAGPPDVPGLLRAAAAASQHLLDRRRDWLPDLSAMLLGPDGTHIAAPAHRLCSAQQSALMLREGPRLPAVGCETGDWSHVDVYLTKTTDYRLLLLPGSRWTVELLRWTGERGSTVVCVGADQPGATACLRYPGDEADDVRLLSEVLVAELIAADAWTVRRP